MKKEAGFKKLGIQYRLNADHTQEQTSQALGCNLATIKRWENYGHITADEIPLAKLFSELFIDTDYEREEYLTQADQAVIKIDKFSDGGELLRAIRENCMEITQEEATQRLNSNKNRSREWNDGRLSRIEGGEVTPDWQEVEEICTVYGRKANSEYTKRAIQLCKQKEITKAKISLARKGIKVNITLLDDEP